MEKEEITFTSHTIGIILTFPSRILIICKIYFDDGPTATSKIKAMALNDCEIGPAYPNVKVEAGSRDLGKLRKLFAFKVLLSYLIYC